jgi:hypothetical protein
MSKYLTTKNTEKFLYLSRIRLTNMINRRKLLKATAVGGSGLAALAYSPRPTLAASNWTANSPSQVSNENGELSSLEIPASGFSFSMDYSGLGAGPHLINFELEAKLSGDSSFETVFTDSFEVTGDSGTVSESKLSTSFPVDLLASTSMSASDFAESNSGKTETTTVNLRASFSWSDGEYSASDSATSSFDVSVEKTGPGGPTDGLIAHYPFDVDASDATSNGNDATVHGATHEDNEGPQSDGAYYFNNDDYIDTGLNSEIEGLSGMTWSAWVRFDSYEDKNEIIGRRESSWSNHMRIGHDNKGNKITFTMYSSSNLAVNVAQSEFPTGTYHLITGVFDNGEIRLYKNDTLKGSDSGGPSTTPSYSPNLWLGRIHGAGRTHKGIIDEVRIYDRALTESEIADLYNATS